MPPATLLLGVPAVLTRVMQGPEVAANDAERPGGAEPMGSQVSMGVLVLSGGDVTAGPVGGVPVAVAVLSATPASASGWVMLCVPVQVVVAPGASVVVAQMAAASSCGSLMTRPVSVTLPVLVTRKL